METKSCTLCGYEKNIDQFSFKNKKKNKRTSECKECHKELRKHYYTKNKDKEYNRVRTRRQELGKWLQDYKKTLSCNRCSENAPECLDFHHKNPKAKEGTINYLLWIRGFSIKRVLSEIKKCEVLCANCHRKLHAVVT